ncbi:MAG TPA: Rieske (2Fe-2S) protein [Chthoniobacterales bacterium]|nr:Rieske (2Fe-2S) protein [Chthoniobacterales bacterium]
MSSPEKPTDPPTPCACEGPGGPGDASKGRFSPSRRDFLLAFGVGLNALAGALIGIPVLGYVLSTFAKKYDLQRIPLGPISNFPEGTTTLATYKNPYSRKWDGDMDDIPCWVRHIKGDQFQVFAINCAHLGCPVRWFAESKFFMCPCHGGVYYEDGSRAAGPPPRGLFQYEHKVEGGQLVLMGGVMPTLATPNV